MMRLAIALRVILAGLLLLCSSSHAATPQDSFILEIEFDSTDAEIDVAPFLRYLHDPEAQLIIDEVSRLPLSDFQALEATSSRLQVNGGFGATWVHFRISNPNTEDLDLVLETTSVRLDEYSIFSQRSGAWQEQRLGKHIDGTPRIMDVFEFAVPIEVDTGSQDFYLRISAGREPQYLWSCIPIRAT